MVSWFKQSSRKRKANVAQTITMFNLGNSGSVGMDDTGQWTEVKSRPCRVCYIVLCGKGEFSTQAI